MAKEPYTAQLKAMFDALHKAGIVDDPRNTARVLIDIRPGRIPMIYVEKFGDPTAIAEVAASFGPAGLVGEEEV
jgi:hypothetical protein